MQLSPTPLVADDVVSARGSSRHNDGADGPRPGSPHSAGSAFCADAASADAEGEEMANASGVGWYDATRRRHDKMQEFSGARGSSRHNDGADGPRPGSPHSAGSAFCADAASADAEGEEMANASGVGWYDATRRRHDKMQEFSGSGYVADGSAEPPPAPAEGTGSRRASARAAHRAGRFTFRGVTRALLGARRLGADAESKRGAAAYQAGPAPSEPPAAASPADFSRRASPRARPRP
eukprot:gene28845-48526_t